MDAQVNEEQSDVQISRNHEVVTIRVVGHFGFTLHKKFREAWQNYQPGTRYVVDLGETTYIDSSALGMLLVLREEVGGDHSDIRIARSNQDVRKILKIANFDQLFNIS
jgi:anti-anti-sigma factor